MARAVPPNPNAPCAWCDEDRPNDPIRMPRLLLPLPGKRWLQCYPVPGIHGHESCLEKHGVPFDIYGVPLQRMGTKPAEGELDNRPLNITQALREETVRRIGLLDRMAIEVFEAEQLEKAEAIRPRLEPVGGR